MALEILEALDEADINELESLINAGFDIHEITPKEDWTYLHKALMSPRDDDQCPAESVEYLIDKGLDVNAIDNYGYTPLIYAVRQRNVPAMQLLLANGAELTLAHKAKDGSTALNMVFDSKPYMCDVIKVLLDAGANPDHKEGNAKSFREMVHRLDDMPPEVIELVAKY